MIHQLKILKVYADAILSGDKTFEVRDNSDRGFQKGDLIHFNVVDNLRLPISSHQLNNEEFEITYVLSGWGIKEGWVVFGIRKVIQKTCVNCRHDHSEVDCYCTNQSGWEPISGQV